MRKRAGLGLFTLIALVVGNMIGAGVFTTSGFAMADLGSPLYVMLAWLVGGLVALCGAISYGALARLMPVSGGEYFFLSRAVHPLAGFVAGWISLWAGFTAAIAFAAISFEVYLLPLFPPGLLPGNTLATLVILLAAMAHGIRVRRGALLQNIVVYFKLLAIAGFILFVLVNSDIAAWKGVGAWQNAAPQRFSVPAFAMTLMWVSFAYSGFNASIYVASEVHDPRRNVPAAMIYATVLVMLLYLLLNGIFVFAPEAAAIAGHEDVAARAARALAGETLATIMRGIIVVALFTSISAMLMAGPRVYAQMAQDGLLPAFLRFEGDAPTATVALQALLSIAVVWVSELRQLLTYLGFTLGLSSVATVISLFIVVRRRRDDLGNPPAYPWAPAIYIVCTLLFLVLAAANNPGELLAALLTILSALIIYGLFGRQHQSLCSKLRSHGDVDLE